MNKVKLAIIGCGSIATAHHIPCYKVNPHAEILYFCDIIPERARAAADDYKNGSRAVTDYKEVLANPEVEAVDICTPNKMHSVISVDALRAGKHVLCEKPAAINYAQALQMQKAQQETGKILNIGVVNRFEGHINLIKKYIEEGRLGEVYHVYASFRAYRSIPGIGGDFTTKAVAGGGSLIDWGVHYIDLVMYCTGSPKPLTVSGETFCKLGKNISEYAYRNMWAGPPILDGTYDVDDSCCAIIRTEGPVITVNGAWAQNVDHQEEFVDFMGTKGGIRLIFNGDFTFYTVENGAFVKYVPEVHAKDRWNGEIDSFVECVRTGEKLPSHIDYAILTSKIMQGIYDSSEAHREVVFED